MTRVAAIDCGTNSIRLLVADTVGTGAGAHLVPVERLMEIVRLGQDVDRTGRLADEALARTFAATRRYAERIERLGAVRVRFVATSATRDAVNRDQFTTGVREILGVAPEVVSGAEEAELSFAGATGDLVAARMPAPYLVVDIGGGSTELVRGGTGSDATRVLAGASIDVGSVRLTERHLHADPPTSDQVEAARGDIHRALHAAAERVPLAEAGTVVGLAGTVTTVAAMVAGLREYDSARIHLARLTADQVAVAAHRLLRMTMAERGGLAFLHPGRADVIAGGALLLTEILAAIGAAELVASEHDILDGIALGMLADPRA
ncbi:MAG: Ppx/GppA phosphatase family protein [Actinomycetes bacterium]